jgi:hypothetical protein
MGLNVSHDAFDGAYSAFQRLRQEVAHAIGGSYPPHFLRNAAGKIVYKNDFAIVDDSLELGMWYWDSEKYSKETHPGLYEFLCHSDCDGEISPEMCVHVADELEALLPLMPIGGDGHIAREGGCREVLRRFIAGCRDAAEANEPLTFG